ncbi:MAG: hypothetical protein OXC63_08265 [Aestuariivita sp.]|nr:hypothetical protein [Aestuariivita sp.]MCY4345385.1 hypothetical protein [Aestuariivita sp.]
MKVLALTRYMLRITALWLLTALAALACTEDDILELVGQLEAPGGYDTVYSGATPPPRPLSSMTVDEVLLWQRQTARAGSVSTAAGQYQVIRPTLQRLVDQGVVSGSQRFDAGTQDRIGRHLLRETGYRDGDTSPETANRIAQVWAALPDLRTGQSAYEGISGNHSLITASSWQGVLDCSIAPNDPRLAAEIDAIQLGERFGFNWDRALEEMAESADRTMNAMAGIAIGLLLTLFVIDLVIRGGGWLFAGRLPGMMRGLVLRLLIVLLCLGLLLFPDVFLQGLRSIAFEIAGAAGAGEFSVANFAAGRMVLVFSLLEGLMIYPAPVRASIQAFVLPIIVTGGAQIAAMIYWTLNLVLIGASGLLALGFGGLQEMTPTAKAYMRHMIGAALALVTALVVMALTTPIAAEIMAASRNPLVAAITILLMEVIATVLVWYLPQVLAAIAGGPKQKHPKLMGRFRFSSKGKSKSLTSKVGA